MSIPYLMHPSFQFDAVHYGYFTKRGGVSEHAFTSLNCGFSSGDFPKKVIENRRRVAAKFGLDAAKLLTCKQTHSNKVITVTEPWHYSQPPEGDGLVTKEKGLAICVTTADCVPVLFYDTQNNIIGAAHSGWRGSISGVSEETITAMEQIGGRVDTIHACIGPCIQQRSYEVGTDIYSLVMELDQTDVAFFKPSTQPEHFMFDLPGYVKKRLKARGIQHISILNHDTLRDEQQFYSFRRKVLRNEMYSGTQISVITLR